MMSKTVQRQLGDAICDPAASPSAIYAILDGAVVRQLPDAFESMNLRHACLFRSETGPPVLTHTPWLVKAEAESEVLGCILREFWGHNRGMFAGVPCDTKFGAVLGHFQ